MKLRTMAGTAAVCTVLTSGILFAQKTTLTGTVSDQMCGAKHMMAGGAAKCTRVCVGTGSAYALIAGQKVYTLKGHPAELNHLAGQNVVVQGTVSGTTVDVSSVVAASK